MEEQLNNEEENATINYRGKYCLIKYILHLLKDDTDKFIRQKNLKIDINSSSYKSTIGNINYAMTINSLHYNKKIDIKENLPKIQKINSSNYLIRDEFNNNVNYNEISIKVNLIPNLEKHTIIDFNFFNFFFYNGKIFHKFVLTPNPDDEFADDRCKLFIYFYFNTNKSLCGNLLNDLDKITKDQNVWKVISHIYIVIPVKDKEEAKTTHEENLNYLKMKENKLPRTSLLYLSDDIKDGNSINIFANYYQKKYSNYFFIINNSNKVRCLGQTSTIYNEFIKFSDDYIKKKNPVGTYKNNKKEKKEKLRKFFNFLSKFIDEIPNLNYILDFYFNMKFSILLDEPGSYFKLHHIEKLEVGGNLRTKDYQKFKKFYDEIKSEKYVSKLFEIETKDIPINFDNPFKCKICKKEIPKDKECYYCYVCVDFYCYECVKNNFTTKTGINKFIDKKHNLIFFKTRNKNNFLEIDLHKFGKNSFTKSTSFKSSHGASCDGCSSSFYGSQRFICMTCKPGLYLPGGYSDYCTNCIEHMMANDGKGKTIQQKLTQIQNNGSTFCRNHTLIEKHDHENHIYLMVALEGSFSSYKEF